MYQYNCAQAWLNSGQNYERALALFDECSGHEDELPYIPMQKSKCLFYLGLRDQAQSVLEHIIQSTENEFVKKDSEALLQELRKQT